MNNKTQLLFCFLFAGQVLFAQSKPEQNLRQLSKQHQFVKMDSLNNKLKNKNYYFYKGLYANVCNNPKLSNIYLDSLKNNPIVNSYEFTKLKNDNYIKLFNYELAYTSSKTLTTKFKKHWTKEDLNDEINAQRIWQTLRNKPVQSIDIFSTITIPTVKDKAGLITTNVSANKTETNFVFDTGAGISCITESLANRMGLTILPDNNISVESFSGQKNKVLIGIAPEINLGELKIQNAVFLVYPDSAFTFANGAYVINGIIGFPIAKELGTITIEKDKLTFSKNSETDKNEKNLFIDQLRAIVMLTYKGKVLPFNFDSGANTSLFNKAFYEKFKSDIDAIGNLETTNSAGAGGEIVSTEVLVLKEQELFLGKDTIQLQRMEIDRNNYGVYGKVSFGNIGQDVIGQFKKVIISFEDSYLKLEN
ncbi:MAG TPA: retropepsin-like aspartic protease [Flavobacterium sp.]|uniref:retropepsin-like aspartic protease family protein n=1 Tax=Flavobacterium sp. TaxID=239 RepID=UPI002CD1FF8F|nr:retropepsin-like aspartic protease [Flavobacterium sp.]HSD15592.1 retropepsin-like aspartic protease [Flavobacterium sp.]